MSTLADPKAALAAWHPDAEASDDTLVSDVLRRVDACFEGSPYQRPEGEVSPWALVGFFHEVVATEALGPDGHPHAGHGLIPPIAHHGRVHAGTDVTVHTPLLADTTTHRATKLHSVDVKDSASGPLAFVSVERIYIQHGVRCLTEVQRHAYRLTPRTSAPASVGLPTDGGSGFRHDHDQLVWSADEVALFRFSAVTGNTHRIHYDADYARHVEGYPGLVVHGPMQTIALEHALRAYVNGQGRPLSLGGTVRLRQPLFVGDTVTVNVFNARTDNSSGDNSDDGARVRAELRGSGGQVVASLTLHDLQEGAVPSS